MILIGSDYNLCPGICHDIEVDRFLVTCVSYDS